MRWGSSARAQGNCTIRCPQIVSSSLWKIGRVAKRALRCSERLLHDGQLLVAKHGLLLQLCSRSMYPTLDLLFSQEREKPLDLIDPRRRCRHEMNLPTLARGKPDRG